MSSRSKTFVLAVLAAATLSACATSTPYQPVAQSGPTQGGYSELRLEPNRFRVNFQGNSLTSRETVEGYLLYRAAELTIQNGYDWFAIVDRETDKQTRTYVEPDPFYRPWYGSYGFWRPSWRYYGGPIGWRSWNPYWGDPFWADRVDVRTIEKFEASAEIVMERGRKPEGDIRAFDARAVMENLRSRVRYPEPRS